MENTENEGIILNGFMSEHAAIMDKVLRMNGEYTYYDRSLARYVGQMERIEALIFKILDSNDKDNAL